MRILHISDLHIGKVVNGYPMINDQRFVLEQVLGMLEEHGVSALLLAGDIYDRSVPSADAVACLDWFLTAVSELRVPVIAVPGNHDSAERLAFASSILRRQGVYFPPAFDRTVESVTLSDDYGAVNFWLIPYLTPTSVRPFFPEEDCIRDYTAALSAVIEAAGIDPTQRNVAISHQFVTGSTGKTERADEELSLGGTDNVDASVYACFDYVALGHVHRAQRIAGRDEVRYSGSILKYSSSEARFDKSAVLVEIGPKGDGDEPGSCTSVQLLPLRPLHDVRCIRGSLDELTSTEILSAADPKDYVYVTLTDEFRPMDATERIRNAYPNFMSIGHERPDCGEGIDTDAAVPTQDVDPFELCPRFFAQQTGHEMTETQAKIARKLLEKALGAHAASSDEHEKGGML